MISPLPYNACINRTCHKSCPQLPYPIPHYPRWDQSTTCRMSLTHKLSFFAVSAAFHENHSCWNKVKFSPTERIAPFYSCHPSKKQFKQWHLFAFHFSKLWHRQPECLSDFSWVLILIMIVCCNFRYGIHLWDIGHIGTWEGRTTWCYYTDLLLDLGTYSVDLVHHLHMLVI